MSMKRRIMYTATPILFTQMGFEAVLREKEELLAKRPEVVKELAHARSMGDLSENGYYKAARQKLSTLDARLRHLESLRRRAQIVSRQQTGVVEIGATVTLQEEGTKILTTYQIVGGHESDPIKGTISYRSPIGSACMGKVRDSVITVETPKGSRSFRIVDIT